MYSMALQWRSFTANEGEAELRAAEQDFLLRFSDQIDGVLNLYALVRPWNEEEVLFGERPARLRAALRETIKSRIEPRAIDAASSYVTTPGQIGLLRNRDATLAARYLLLNPASPVFAEEGLERPRSWLARRVGTQERNVDALEWLMMLMPNQMNDGTIGTNEERQSLLVENRDFTGELWDAVVSSPHQFRMVQSLRERRANLLRMGIPEERLAAPAWMLAEPQL
jgi:hypothetical protein